MKKNALRIPFHKPSFDQSEIDEVVDTLKSGWITTGEKTHRFEEEFARYVGAKHAIGLNSCTAALHLALEAMNLSEGEEVITVPFTFVATTEVILYCRAKPVFVDCHPGNFNIMADRIEEKITKRTRAILPVHFAGQPCEMDKILAVAKKHGLKVIEDAAHSFPASYKGKMIGSIGDMTCFSFYATKTLSTGEGGMMTTDCAEYAEKARLLSLHGMTRDAWDRYKKPSAWQYRVVALGRKYNLSDLQSSIGIHQLRKADLFLERRRAIARRYNEILGKCPFLETPKVERFEEHAWHLYVIKLKIEDLQITRDDFVREMESRGIGTSVHFIPLTEHPYYKEALRLKSQDYPNAADCYKRIVSLPIYPSMTGDEVEYVTQSVAEILQKGRRAAS